MARVNLKQRTRSRKQRIASEQPRRDSISHKAFNIIMAVNNTYVQIHGFKRGLPVVLRPSKSI